MKQVQCISYLLFFVLISCSSQKMDSNSNFKIITGLVFDSTDMQPLGGAYIKVKGSEKTSTTTFDGKFNIAVKKNDVLIIEYVGFQSKKITIDSQNEYKISLDVYNHICKKCERKRKREIKKYVRNGGRNIPPVEFF